MKEIEIPPSVQLLLLVTVIGAVAAAILTQMPEIQRYLKVRQM